MNTNKIVAENERKINPQKISEKHLAEWVEGSGCDPEIVRLNVETITSKTEIAHRLNYKAYYDGPGFWVSGVDPRTGDRTSLGGQFKSDKPKPNKKTGKTPKYLSPKDKGLHPLFLGMPGDDQYWPNVRANPHIPTFGVEGGKKAGALLSRGYAAFSIPGVDTHSKDGRFHPLLEELCCVGRKVYLVFDADITRKKAVADALDRMGRNASVAGATVYVLTWDESQGKGIDDFLVNGGDFEALLAAAQTFQEWRKARKDAELPLLNKQIDEQALQAAIEAMSRSTDPMYGLPNDEVTKNQANSLGVPEWRLNRVYKAWNFAELDGAPFPFVEAWERSGGELDEWKKYTQSLKSRDKSSSGSSDSSGKSKFVPPVVADYNRVKAGLGNRLRLNTLKNRIELDGKPFSLSGIQLALAIDHGIMLESRREDCADVVIRIARENQYSPVVEYLDSAYAKHGDSTDVLTGFSKRYFGIDHPIYDRFISRFLISAVARAMNPGCKVDTVLILQGPQGYQKSSFFRFLAGQDWFDDSFGKSSDKDERLKLHNSWIIEWAELERVLKRKESGEVKAFITSQVDHLRRPYGRDVEALARSCVLVGTSNEDAFLADATGNRRYWVLPVKKRINVKLLEQERDRIWAAAVALYKRGEQWWLTESEEKAAEAIAERYSVSDPWQYPTEEFVRGLEYASVRDILNHIQPDVSRQTRADEMRVADCLKQLRWRKTLKTIGGSRQKVWVPPTDWSDTTCEPPEPPDTTSSPEVVHPESPVQQNFQYPDTTCNHLNLEKSTNSKNETNTPTKQESPPPENSFRFTEPNKMAKMVVTGGITSQNPDLVSVPACTTSDTTSKPGGGITSQNPDLVSVPACTTSDTTSKPGGGITPTWTPQEGDRVEALTLNKRWKPGSVARLWDFKLRVEFDDGASQLVFPINGEYSFESVRPLTEPDRN